MTNNLPRLSELPPGVDRDTPLWRSSAAVEAVGVSYRQIDRWSADEVDTLLDATADDERAGQ